MSLPPSVRPPEESVTAAVLASLSAPPVVSVPPETLTVSAAEVPASVVAPLEALSVPAPRLAFTAPPVRV